MFVELVADSGVKEWKMMIDARNPACPTRGTKEGCSLSTSETIRLDQERRPNK